MNKPPKRIRCAIYTRKSTEEGLEQEFNSLDAQRESAEAFIKSQAHEGWICLPNRYDDGGFSGGNANRPALQQLLTDIEAKQIDTVVCYKVDRLSRSLLDFAKMMEVFEQHEVNFVSVTQQFSTTNSMGKLTLNILLSFAQFEREIISERTRDKIAATRRKGKWTGGRPILGYNRESGKLVINHDEATRVRAIFRLYTEHGSLLPVVQELNQRGWRNKSYLTRQGIAQGGLEFTRTSLWYLLTNPLYAGQVRHKENLYPGEHEAIIDEVLWKRVQAQLERNGQGNGNEVKNKHGSILKGLLRCVPCGCAMTPSYCCKNGKVQYRYYTCTKAQKQGWDKCPSKSVPAGQIEQFVLDRISCLGTDDTLQNEVFQTLISHRDSELESLAAEERLLDRELKRWHREVVNLQGQVNAEEVNTHVMNRITVVQDRIARETPRLAQVRHELKLLRQSAISPEMVADVLGRFHECWNAMTIAEKQSLLKLLIDQIDYDGRVYQLSISFQAIGLEKFLGLKRET